jgi:hypothetical protein
MEASSGELAAARIAALRRFGALLAGNHRDGNDLTQAALAKVEH